MKCEFLVKHSRMQKLFWSLLTVTMFLLVTGSTNVVMAQMFSVGDPEPTIETPNTAVSVGIEPAEFEYTGSQEISGNGQFAFSGPLLRLRVESQGLDLFMASGGKLTGIDDVSYFDAGIKAAYLLPLYSKEKISVLLPIQLMSSLTTVTEQESLGNEPNFRQGSFVAGAGIRLLVRPVPQFRIEAAALPSYGFAFATGGTFGGSQAATELKFRLSRDRLFNDIGLSVGYDYNIRKFEIDGEQFDYDFTAHSILLGITF